MCGIAGFVCRPGHAPDPAMLRRMADSLAHRGPDGEGFHETGDAALVHRRLSIVDLEGGAQPLVDGSVSLVANGEIYNDPDLRHDLSDRHFRTGSDCESPLYLWPTMGTEYTLALRGMYAIAMLITAESGTVLALSRDPFGIKPLYYIENESGIGFSSEPRALLAAGLAPRAVRPQARHQLLQAQFVTGRETIYPGIMRLLPGETLRFVSGQFDGSRRQLAVKGPVCTGLTEEKALRQLDAALMDSVRVHERADVPFGLFLSGGIDSTAILAAMARLGGERPVAWTARFDQGDIDESIHAQDIASSLGARQEILTVTERMVWDHLPQIVATLDDPVADYAVIPTWFLAREAGQSVRVILSGEGGDELFGGYGRYRRAMRPWWRGGRAPWRRGTMDGLLRLPDGESWRENLRLKPDRSRLRAAQALDLAEWLPNDLLLKLDRCLMAHAIEGRTPLLDPVVAKLAWSLPDHLKIRNGQGKYLLRQWVSQATAEARPFAPKQGFTVPIGTWIAGQGVRLGQMVAHSAAFEGVVPHDAINQIFSRASGRRERHAAWALLFYALWHRIHIENVPAEGDVFHLLGTGA